MLPLEMVRSRQYASANAPCLPMAAPRRRDLPICRIPADRARLGDTPRGCRHTAYHLAAADPIRLFLLYWGLAMRTELITVVYGRRMSCRANPTGPVALVSG